MTKVTTQDGEKRIQTLIKTHLDELEHNAFWVDIDPALANAIRHRIIRIAFGSYKIGLIIERA